MLNTLRILVTLGFVWAAGALALQVRVARAAGRREYARRAGDTWRGLVYNFTTALLPGHKESARLHPVKLGLGVALHVGVLLALTGVILLLASPVTGLQFLGVVRPLVLLGLGAGLALLAERRRAPLLRQLSVPDDYLANAATCGLLMLSGAIAPGPVGATVLLGYALLLLAYVPLGKLRHAVFFFAVRADLGWRLGYRGVYPPRAGTE